MNTPRQSRRARPAHTSESPWLLAMVLVAGTLLLMDLTRLEPSRALEPDLAPKAEPARRWRRMAAQLVRAIGDDRLPAAAAAATFFALLALIPALSAFISLFGIFADAGTVKTWLTALAGILPGGGVTILGDQLARLTATDHGKLGLAFAASVAVSIWSANAGAKALIEALNTAYEVREKRGFIRLNLVALGFTVGAVALSGPAFAFIVAAPEILDRVGVGQLAIAAELRWPTLLALMTLALSILYRYGPCRPSAPWRWVAVGAVVAAAAWLVMSGLFSWYVADFGQYDRTYGSLGAVIGFLTWIWLSMIIVLLGAELNSALERRPRSG